MMSEIKSNFQEIYSALLSSNQEVVANVFGTRLYHVAYGWGRMWKWFYQILSFFDGGKGEKNALCKAIRKTHLLFQSRVKWIEKQVETYQAYLKKEEGGEEKAKYSLLAWQEEIDPFLKLIDKKSDLFTRFVLTFCSQQEGGGEVENPFFVSKEVLFKIRASASIAQLEYFLEDKFPFKALERLALQKELSSEQEEEVRQWAKLIPNDLSVSFFHKALASFVEGLSARGSLADLEAALVDYGVFIFSKMEEKQIRWIEKLSKGLRSKTALVTCAGQGYFLEEELRGLTPSQGQAVFTIRGDDDHVVVIPINRASFLLQKKLEEKRGFLLPTPRVKAIDPSGKVAIVEKLLPLPIFEKENLFSEEACVLCSMFASLIERMVKVQMTPRRLKSHYLGFSKEGELKSIKPLLATDFDFFVLEDFIYDVSKEDPANLSEIVDRYLFEKEPVRIFYDKVFQLACDHEEPIGTTIENIKKLAAREGISNQKALLRGTLLCSEVIKNKEALLSHFFPQGFPRLRKGLYDKIIKEMKEVYKEYKMMHLLPSSFQALVIERIENIPQEEKATW